jgi:G3E family GTPase
MYTEIYIISGFLGAGKTTLIQKLLREAFHEERVVVVENDFGGAGVDASLLREDGARVAELRAGCICCSLAGDLIKTLKKLIARYKPDKLIIEPSGVGKLSDVAAACADAELRALAELRRKITVVDAVRCLSYAENFGEFFTDQIAYADAVLLSHAEEDPSRTEAARALVGACNADAELFCEPWERVRAEALLFPRGRAASGAAGEGHSHDAHCHDEHCHDEHCREAHGLAAEEVFDTVTIRTERAFSADELRARVSRMARGDAGTVLRAKGVLCGTEGCLRLQYIPGDAKIETCAAGDDDSLLSVIGRDLNGPGLASIFDGVL